MQIHALYACIALYKPADAQLINADGIKRTLAGGQVKEAFNRPGGPGDTLWLTEGYATGLTVHRLEGPAVYVALSANNLPALAERVHAEYSAAMILIAADNDENGTG